MTDDATRDDDYTGGGAGHMSDEDIDRPMEDTTGFDEEDTGI